jgi:pilus assembly protein Flp/PilA
MLSVLAYFQSRLVSFVSDEEGQGLAEYALILAFIAVVAISALIFLGSDISSLLSKVANAL